MFLFCLKKAKDNSYFVKKTVYSQIFSTTHSSKEVHGLGGGKGYFHNHLSYKGKGQRPW